MLIHHIIGFTAATLTTIAFVPQAIKTWKSRSTEDLSPVMFALFCVGVALWLVYGFILQNPAMIVANIITIVLAGSIMYFILLNKKPHRIEHIGIWVNDLDTAVEFYTSVFEITTGTRYQNTTKNFESHFINFLSGARVELMSRIEGDIPHNTTPYHFAISVGSKANVDELAQQLHTKGIEILDGPRTTGDGYYEFRISDPDNNIIEVTV